MTIGVPSAIVSTEWLAERLGRPDLAIVDGSWYLQQMGRDAQSEYLARHLPGAVFWDLDAIADQTTPLPHMLPDPATASRLIGALGIGADTTVVAYDGSGNNLSAARVWWTLRVFGHEAVAVLDGGIGKWIREGRPTESGAPSPTPRTFEVRLKPELVRNLEQVRAVLTSPEVGLLDARAAGRFEGRDPEPRPGLASGHVPGAKNLPYGTLVGADGTMLSGPDLRARFEGAGVDLERPVVLSCGSGVSACALALGLHLLGHRDYAVYDGSWAEWGGRSDTPVATGPG